jgi:hypothetical protein
MGSTQQAYGFNDYDKMDLNSRFRERAQRNSELVNFIKFEFIIFFSTRDLYYANSISTRMERWNDSGKDTIRT